MKNKKHKLTVWMIALINVAAICNIKNFPLMAEYGLSTVFFLLLASLLFFIPVSLVVAELSAGWPDKGVYTWVKEGLGGPLGFLAVWLQWIENVIWYPTILSFIASTAAYVFNPALALNPIYVLSVVIFSFWLFTFINFLGMEISGWISSVSVLLGTILPITLILFLGIIWILKGNPLQISMTWGALFPNLTSLHELVLLAGFVLGLAGMEMSAVHAKEVQTPQKTYPIAIFLSAVLILSFSALGSVVIAAIVPPDKLELTSGGMEAFHSLFQAFHIPWATPIVAIVIAIGALGMMSTWIVGPSRGLLATAEHGDLPRFFQKTNKRGMPVSIFWTQGIIVSILSLVFILMPSVSSSFWALSALTSQLYMIMYILMFISAIRLRLKFPHKERPYRIPGGNLGMGIVCGLGITGALFALGISILPPSQIQVGNPALYQFFLIGSIVVFCAIPLLIYKARRPDWKQSPVDRFLK